MSEKIVRYSDFPFSITEQGILFSNCTKFAEQFSDFLNIITTDDLIKILKKNKIMLKFPSSEEITDQNIQSIDLQGSTCYPYSAFGIQDKSIPCKAFFLGAEKPYYLEFNDEKATVNVILELNISKEQQEEQA